jgi:hypothetical protein
MPSPTIATTRPAACNSRICAAFNSGNTPALSEPPSAAGGRVYGPQLAQTPAYTGLIIDASGLAAEPAMGPFIVGAGARVHVSQKIDIDPEKIVQQGPLHYVADINDAKADTARIGANPLIVRAKAATGEPVRSNILLDPTTALKVIDINKNAKFLDDLKVTLVL